MKDSEVLELLIDLGSIISEMFGDDCEVAISQDREVVAIFNGHVSNRVVGSTVGPEADERINSSADGTFVNYSKSNLNNPEHNLKASTFCLELDGKFTTFCINYDNSQLLQLHRSLTNFLTITGVNVQNAPVVRNPLEEDFLEAKEQVGKPVHLMTKQERLKVIEILHEKGSLNYQKSIVNIAKLLGVTRYTIYNYLKILGIQKSPED